MTYNSEALTVPALADSLEPTPGAPDRCDTGKKIFVEPELSNAVDVLEATTFFQFVDSGASEDPT